MLERPVTVAKESCRAQLSPVSGILDRELDVLLKDFVSAEHAGNVAKQVPSGSSNCCDVPAESKVQTVEVPEQAHKESEALVPLLG